MNCANCGKKHSGGLCPWCGHVTEAPKPTEAQLESLARRSEVRHGVPALLSFFVPGLGQLIKGNVGTALSVWFGLGVLIGVGVAGLWLTFLGIPILWIWSLYDAYVAPDGPARREMDRFGMGVVVLVACALAGAGCGNVTALATDDGGTGGTSGAAGRVGVESDAGGAAGGSVSTGGAGGGTSSGTGGAQATGGSGTGGIVTQATGGTHGTGGAAGAPACVGTGQDLRCYIALSATPSPCSAGWTCTIGTDGTGRISQPAGSSDFLCGCFGPTGQQLACSAGTTCGN